MPENTSITNSAAYELANKTGYYEFGEIEFTIGGEPHLLTKSSIIFAPAGERCSDA